MLVYKLLRSAEWASLEATGRFTGSPDDVRDGFIHLSTAEQLPVTHARYFAHVADAVVVILDGATLGAALRWEPSRGGALFPHLYRPIERSEVLAARPVADDPLLH